MPSVAVYVAGGSRVLTVFTDARVPLFSSTLAIGNDQRRILVPAGATWTEPGSRVLRTAAQRAELREQEVIWQQQSQVSGLPGETYHDAAQLALLDLRALMFTDPVAGAVSQPSTGPVVAGWSGSWRYVWPRDSAFVVAALAATGHADDAARLLAFLQRVQSADGTFQARYRPATELPPDRRGVQLDGIGWSLWGLLQWARSRPDETRVHDLRPFTGLLDRAATACLRLTARGTSLPPVSSDFWEVPTTDVTLGNAALFLVGFQAAARLYGMLGDPHRSAVFHEAGRHYRKVITRNFAADGYPRHQGGRSRDAAVAFLLPPFVDDVDASVLEAWRLAGDEMLRPAGGLAPGARWPQDGVSWTPGTAVFAMTAAEVDDQDSARRRLDWLLTHRTTAGSFPEKVLSDGSPASVAPLAWPTAAAVLALNRSA